jgi:hypothetical protein
MGTVSRRCGAKRTTGRWNWSGEWDDDDYDVLADGVVVGGIMKVAPVPVGQSWMWTLAFGHHEDRTANHLSIPRNHGSPIVSTRVLQHNQGKSRHSAPVTFGGGLHHRYARI